MNIQMFVLRRKQIVTGKCDAGLKDIYHHISFPPRWVSIPICTLSASKVISKLLEKLR